MTAAPGTWIVSFELVPSLGLHGPGVGEESHGSNRRTDQTLYCHTAGGAGLTHSGTGLAAAPEPFTRACLAHHQP